VIATEGIGFRALPDLLLDPRAQVGLIGTRSVEECAARARVVDA
jgi:hypothetical protein